MKKIVVNSYNGNPLAGIKAHKEIILASEDGNVLVYKEPNIDNYIFPGGDITESCLEILDNLKIPVPYKVPEEFLQVINYDVHFEHLNGKIKKLYYKSLKALYLFMLESKDFISTASPNIYLNGKYEGVYEPMIVSMTELGKITQKKKCENSTVLAYKELNEIYKKR